jgi:hypothetical protein
MVLFIDHRPHLSQVSPSSCDSLYSTVETRHNQAKSSSLFMSSSGKQSFHWPSSPPSFYLSADICLALLAEAEKKEPPFPSCLDTHLQPTSTHASVSLLLVHLSTRPQSDALSSTPHISYSSFPLPASRHSQVSCNTEPQRHIVAAPMALLCSDFFLCL